MAETSDTEMVFRVARAISGAPLPSAASRRKAEAAIRAMREPTDPMIQASNREWDGRMSARSAGVWQAMIDAALPSPPSPG